MKGFKFRSGKHEGESLEEVERIDPTYVAWIRENRPEMLKEHVENKKEPRPFVRKEPKEDSEIIPSALQPNLDFFNEGKVENEFYKKL